MWTLSGFSEEISADFQEQCRHVRDLAMGYIEFRSAWDTNVLDLDEAHLQGAEEVLRQFDLRVSSIGSPIGKIRVDEDFAPHLKRARYAIDVTQRFGAEYIRIFSFFVPEHENADDHRDVVLERMRQLTALAAEAGVVLLHENEKLIYGDIPSAVRRCHRVRRLAAPEPGPSPGRVLRPRSLLGGPPGLHRHPRRGRYRVSMKTAAIVGCGDFSVIHAEAFSTLEDTELVAVVDTDETVLGAAAQRYVVPGHSSPARLIEAGAPDVVRVCAPHDQHVEVVVEALGAGASVVWTRHQGYYRTKPWRGR